MSKRTQLYIALGALGVVILLLAVLFVAVMGSDDEGTLLEQAAAEVWEPEAQGPPSDPTAGRGERAQNMVWAKTAESSSGSQRLSIRQSVETDLLRRSFPNLHWARIERVGWRAFQQEGSVYEAQFVLRDHGVELGPAWLVQTDPAGLQPPGSGGVVPANVFADVVQFGPSAVLERYLGREAEVVEALTNHRFELGARLPSAMLVYFLSQIRVSPEDLLGWTVVGDRLREGEPPTYRAFFQWRDGDQTVFANWLVNVETQQFRAQNLLASEIMATGDAIDAAELESIRPRMLDEQEPTRSTRRLFEALRAIVDNQQLLEAVSALLWHRARHGAAIEYSRWNARRTQDDENTFEVSYEYLENGETRSIVWHVGLDNGAVTPVSDLARMARPTLVYELPARQVNGHD